MNYHKIFRKSAVASAIAATAFGVQFSAVQAQEVTDEEGFEIEEVFVTGSRIARDTNLESASPVTQVDADEFLFTGITRVEDLLNDLPQVTGSNVANDANGATGTANVDLRDLGTQRTLTLFNGRRLPIGSPLAGGAGADLNFIPSALVQRVEVLTGGGSATYGSDAIAGVVNFITQDNFEGLRVDVQGSIYQHKNDNSRIQQIVSDTGFDLPDSSVRDGESYSVSLVGGKNFNEGRGNITGYVTYRETEEIRQAERDYSACSLRGNAGDNTLGCGGSSTLPQGRFTDFGVLSPNSFDYVVQGNEFVPRNGALYNFAPDNFFQRPDERVTAGFLANYDFSDDLTGYVEVGYMKNETKAQIAPSGNFFVTSSLNCGNPLLSAQQFQLLCGDFGLTAADSQTVFTGRRNVEGGPRADNLEHEQSRIVLGLKGNINDNWSFDANFNHGRVELDRLYQNDLSTTRIGRALDAVTDPATGNVVCRSVLDGSDPACSPWNLFQTGGVSQEAVDYLVLPLTATGETKLTNVTGFVSGDLDAYGIRIPGAPAAVQVVAGLEYRKDELTFSPDANYQSGDGAGQGGPSLGVNGSLSAKEVFFEAAVPITDTIDTGLGFRYSDYDTGQTTDTYKFTFDWRVLDGLKARASFQAASRHANVRELFVPQGIGLFNGTDPCAGAAPTASAAQCANSGVTAAQYGTIAASPAGQYNQITGGNPDLEPEESDTVSFGVVFTPESVPGLDITLDWFNIDVQGAVNGAGSQFLLDQCVFSGEFCGRINRGAQTGTLWVGQDNVVNTNANIGFQERAGVDASVNYKFNIGDNNLSVSYTAAFVTKNDRQPVPDAAIVDCNGKWDGSCFAPNPEYRHNMRLSWGNDSGVTASLAWRHHGAVEQATTSAIRDDFDAQDYFDLAALWSVNDKLTFRAGINNIFDKEPPLSANGSNGNVEVTEYDVLGRYIFMGASYDL